MNSRILQLDGLRGIAVLAVFIHHALHVAMLWMGVDLFFVLSGFLITGMLLERKEQGRGWLGYFYRRRTLRILPPYVLILLIFTLAKGTGWMKVWYFYAFFAMNIGTAFFSIPFTILWSLAVEEQFYLVWPFIVRHFTPRRMLVVAISLVCTAPVLRAICSGLFPGSMSMYFLTPFRMDTLASGAVLAYVWRYHRTYFERCFKFASMLGSAGLVALLFITWDKTLHTSAGNVAVYECTLAISVGAVMLALRGRGFFQEVLMMRSLRYVGTISYSMYLFHQFATEALEPVIRSKVLYFIASLAVTVGYASLSWWFVERPVLGSASDLAIA